jgi:putative CRISPR-associated protein (TIGR02619 family)
MSKVHTVLCTVGTSLVFPNLNGLPRQESEHGAWLRKQPERDQEHLGAERVLALRRLWDVQDASELALALGELPTTVRLLGAEVNSLADAARQGHIQSECRVVLCTSDTEDGAFVGRVLKALLEVHGHEVKLHTIEGLQDADSQRFRTVGLRMLAQRMAETIREWGAESCAINATGGYKAQVAVAALLGQALQLPVFYKHERFEDGIIHFPPMPVSLDLQLALKHAGLLVALEHEQLVAFEGEVRDEWEERLETLVEREDIDGVGHLSLSAVGQIFLEAVRDFLHKQGKSLLPPAAKREAKAVQITEHDWGNARTQIQRIAQRVVDEVPYVVRCRTHYWNPDLNARTCFRRHPDGIEFVYAISGKTIKFIIELSEHDEQQFNAALADLNLRLKGWR